MNQKNEKTTFDETKFNCNGNFEAALAALFEKLGSSSEVVDAIRNRFLNPYECWRAYRRFPEDNGPCSVYFNCFENMRGGSGDARAKRSYLHLVFSGGKERVVFEARRPKRDIADLLTDSGPYRAAHKITRHSKYKSVD